jgi:hypothetical protein
LISDLLRFEEENGRTQTSSDIERENGYLWYDKYKEISGS